MKNNNKTNKMYSIPVLPLNIELETKAILKQVNVANKKLAELKGVVKTMPKPSILLNTLSLQEAKDSSAIESIITTHDELYRAELLAEKYKTAASKEVQGYANALIQGFMTVQKTKLITNNTIITIYQNIKFNTAGFRTTPGTNLVNDQTKEIIYEPPQDISEIQNHMKNLEQFINDKNVSDLDPLIKMAVIHHQFESIHPFSDGNGRTGRIINILYLIQQDLLDYPVLYLSRYIISHKAEYYRLLQGVRDSALWHEWVLFMLKAVEQTAAETIILVESIRVLMQKFKNSLRTQLPKIYSQDLLNNLFNHPYTKIDFVMNDLGVSRLTATNYLDKLVSVGLLGKLKIGRNNFYTNNELFDLLINAFHSDKNEQTVSIDSQG